MERCTKCASSSLLYKYGYTKEGGTVFSYNFLQCPICGFVKHLYNSLDRKAYILERVSQIRDELHIPVRAPWVIKPRDVPSSLGPK